MKFQVILVLTLLAMSTVVIAQAELPDPGMTPDSPLYFLDTLFDALQSDKALANEKAAEVVAMAQEGNEKGLEKAMGGYNKAMTKREAKAANSEDVAVDFVNQAADHLEVLARVREQVPETAKPGIDNAMERSAQGLDRALDDLERQNNERAGLVAQETLQRVMENTPEAAQKGLQNALEAVQRNGPPENKGKPTDPGSAANENKPNNIGVASQASENSQNQ